MGIKTFDRHGREITSPWLPYDGPVTDRAALLANLAPGGGDHHYVLPRSTWHRFVEAHVARRDGDVARADALDAELKAAAATGWASVLATCSAAPSLNVSLPAPRDGNETLNDVQTKLGALADRVRAAAARNYPDVKHNELGLIADELDALRGALG